MFKWIKQLSSHSSFYLPCNINKWTSKSLFPLRPEKLSIAKFFKKESLRPWPWPCQAETQTYSRYSHIQYLCEVILKLDNKWGHKSDDNVFLKIATVTLTLALERSNSNLSNILSCITPVWSYSKIGPQIKALERWQCFSKKNSHCDLDLGPRTLKLKLFQDIVIINICMIFNQNRLINKGARVMTKFF